MLDLSCFAWVDILMYCFCQQRAGSYKPAKFNVYHSLYSLWIHCVCHLPRLAHSYELSSLDLQVLEKYTPGGITGHDHEGCPVWVFCAGDFDMRGMLECLTPRELTNHIIYLLELCNEDMHQQSVKVRLSNKVARSQRTESNVELETNRST